MRISRDGLYLLGGVALLMAAPVLQLARANLDSLIWQDFWVTLLVVVGIQSSFIAFLALIFPNRLGIAAAVALTILLSSNYIEIEKWLSSVNAPAANSVTIIILGLLGPIFLMVFAVLPTGFFTRSFGSAGAAIFALAVVQLIASPDFVQSLAPTADANSYLNDNPLPSPEAPEGKLPDIIYIVPDRYGSSNTLTHEFHHDNSDFLDALRQRGFAVADSARANYLKTQYSLASSMNLQYLEALQHALNGNTRRPQPLYSLIQENLVVERLKQMGYRYIHVPTWWDGTRESHQGDLISDFWPVSFGGDFGQAVVLQNPIFLLAIVKFYQAKNCDSLKRQLAYLEDVGGDERPTFTFAHVLAPHSPILTDSAGRCIDPIDFPIKPPGGTWEAFTEAYSGYVRYINRRFLEIFDRQKANNPNPLIFVLQADEGPYPKAYREYLASANDLDAGTGGSEFDWRNATDEQLAMKFGILNALYLGDPDSSNGGPAVPDTLTPVNNWRVIFGRLEGRAYPLLPDRHFIFPTNQEPYHWIEITERLREIAP